MTMSDRIQIDAAVVRSRIDVLLRTYPELADDDDLLADALEGQTDLHVVAGRVLDLARQADTMVVAVSTRRVDLQERQARFARRSEAMHSLLKSLLDTAGVEKLVLPEATVSITKAREHVVVTDANELPQGYFATIRQPDKVAIGKSLKAGEAIPGAALAFGESGLTIRTK